MTTRVGAGWLESREVYTWDLLKAAFNTRLQWSYERVVTVLGPCKFKPADDPRVYGDRYARPIGEIKIAVQQFIESILDRPTRLLCYQAGQARYH